MLLAAALGIGVGILVGVLGAGGGILAIPMLTYLLGQTPHGAAMGSLAIVGLTAIASLPGKARRRHVNWKTGIVFGVLAIVGSAAGSHVSILVSENLLMALFAALVLAMAVAMGLQLRHEHRDNEQEMGDSAGAGAGSGAGSGAGDGAGADDGAGDEAGAPGGTHEGQREHRVGAQISGALGSILSNPWAIIAGLTVGFLTGFFGVGGGFMVVPALTLVLHFDIRKATGTSLLIMVLASAAGLLARIGQPVDVAWDIVIAFGIASMLGGIAGGEIAGKFRRDSLSKAFIVLLIVVGVFTVIRQFVLHA